MEEKLYGVLCTDEQGRMSMCNIAGGYSSDVGTKKQCKSFIDEYSTLFSENTYKLFKLKFEEY